MIIDPIIRERVVAVVHQLEEVFSDFIIVGLPLDKKQAPIVASSGEANTAKDLLAIANKRKDS